ncbi:MAG: DUF4124 domain-containing protein [Rhodocyclaceae bacterium]|nr:DUF4124 domain-containing protein [Rhodocyclaceae bacterium]
MQYTVTLFMPAFAMKTALFLMLGALSGSAMADTLYKCTDKSSDSVLFTNQRVANKQCSVLSRIEGGNGSGSSATNSPRPRAASTPTPSDFPRVSSDTQKERDGGRRTILEQELANEQRNLDEAKKSNNANKAQLHERNIAALQKELGNLR